MLMLEASFLVSHSNIVSVFDLRLNKWVQNIIFDYPIIQIIDISGDYNIRQAIVITEKYDKFVLAGDANYNSIADQSKMGQLSKNVFLNEIYYTNTDDLKSVDKIL
jgi:hypothetical protein